MFRGRLRNITRSPIQFLRTVNKGNWPSRVSKPENLPMNLYALVNSNKIQTVIQSSCFFGEASTLKILLTILRDRSNTNTKDNRNYKQTKMTLMFAGKSQAAAGGEQNRRPIPLMRLAGGWVDK